MILPSGKIYGFLLVEISPVIDTGSCTRIISLFGIASVKTAILFYLRMLLRNYSFSVETTSIRLTFVTKEGWGAGCLHEKEPSFSSPLTQRCQPLVGAPFIPYGFWGEIDPGQEKN